MRKREACEYWTLGAVVHLVEEATAKRAGLSVSCLRTLIRLAAITSSGAKARALDVDNAGNTNKSRASAQLKRMRKAGGWVILTGGANGTGTYSLSPRGAETVNDYARAWRRAGLQVEQFEPVQPWRRLKPLISLLYFIMNLYFS